MNNPESGVFHSYPEKGESDENLGVITNSGNNINQKEANSCSPDDVFEKGQSSASKRKQVFESLEGITLRRRKFKEKVNDLRNLIPNCDKKDTSSSSTVDDAIAYIKGLRYELQMKSMRSGFPLTSEQILHNHYHTFLHIDNVAVRGSNGLGILSTTTCPTSLSNQECKGKESRCCYCTMRGSIARATSANQESTSRPTTQPPPPE